MDTPQRIVVKLKLPRELRFDLTKSLKRRWATKARTPRLPVIIGVSSSENQKVLMDDDYSGNLKRKFDQTEEINPSGKGDHCKINQKTDSEGEIAESEIKIDETSSRLRPEGCIIDDIKNLQVVSSVPMAHKRYACSLCSKTFSSHQALGGHKSSHYKFTMKIYDAIDDGLRPPKKQLLISSTTTCHQQIGDDRTHCYTCKICLKKFPSAQALGGHQRRHWTGNMKSQSARKILDFDLNELPKEEDEDQVYLVHGAIAG